jgi:hypothetical protein
MKKYGTTDPVFRKTPEERFWAKVDKTDGCWNWTANKRNGYGMFLADGKNWGAHRFSFYLVNGEIGPGIEIDHICRNRSCVRPDHLRGATRKQNMENQSVASYLKTESGIRGVTRTSGGSWCARVGHNKKLIHIGVYDTMEEAAEAVRQKRLELHTYNNTDRIAA